MTYDSIEKRGLELKSFELNTKLDSLNKGFESSVKPEGDVYYDSNTVNLDDSISKNFMLDSVTITPEIRASALNAVKDMYHGKEVDGRNTLSLKEIHNWKVNSDYYDANIKQHAGYAAEVISTEKENVSFLAKQSGKKTYRVDDMPDSLRKQFGDRFAAKNDQYVDKIRIDKNGNVETVQTKFVGKDGKECLSKLKSKKYEKYLEDGKVDKIEVPKDYYDDVKSNIANEQKSLKQQIERLTQDGKTEEVAKKQTKLDKLDKLDKMVESSNVTSKEAIFAVEHPKLYAAQQINNAGLKAGGQAAALTAAVSGVDNFQKYRSGELTGTEAIENTAKDTAIAGGVAYGTEIVTQLAGGSSVPAAVITMGVESYGDVKDYAEGDIDGEELAYNLGENAARVVGGAVGSAMGAAAGTVLGPVGNVAGGLAGGAAGSAIAAKAYEDTVENVSDSIENVKGFIDGEIDGQELAYNLGENYARAMGGVLAGDVAVQAYDVSVDFVSDRIDDVAEVSGDVIESIGETTGDMIENTKDMANDVKNVAGDALDSAADKIGNVTGKLADSIGNIGR